MTLFHFSYEEMMRQLEVSMRTVDLILDRGAAALFISYEDVVGEPSAQVASIADHLGVALTCQMIEEITQRTSRRRMKELSDNLGKLDDHRVVQASGPWAYDRETLLHPGHIQDSMTGKGLQQFVPEKSAMVHDRFRTTFRRVGRNLPLGNPNPLRTP